MSDPARELLADLQWSGTGADGLPCCPACRAPQHGLEHGTNCRLFGMLDAGPKAPRWRHRRRGTTYREVGQATLQHSGGTLDDQDVMVVYRAEHDGTLGVRALIEFSDGRFERVD